MKRNRIYFGLILLILVIIIVGAVFEMQDAGRKEKPYTVSVIVEDSNNDRWIAMRQGLEQAAQDHNIKLNYVFSGEFNDMEEEMELIEREVRSGAEGLIIRMVSSDEGVEELEDVAAQTAVMLIETDVEPQGVYAVTGPDNREIGAALGMEVAEDIGDSEEPKKVGILCRDKEQIAIFQRLAGLQKIIGSENIEVLWSLEGSSESIARKLAEHDQEEPVDIIIAMGNDETELAVDYLIGRGEERKGNCFLYGVGCSEKAVYYLDKGWIKSLVVPNEFNMGYLSMEGIAKQLNYRLSNAESVETDYLVIDKDNLYEEENQKILFPIVQ